MKTMSHAEVDKTLDRYAKTQATYVRNLTRFAAKLDREGLHLEIRESDSWRKQGSAELPKTSVRQQFRREVEAILIMGREEEVRLARRIELARLRLDRALAAHGLSQEDLKPSAQEDDEFDTVTSLDCMSDDCTLPAEICQRWQELHAMRCEMVERNLYLALINVERYSHTTASMSDLIQEGSAALFRAVDGFDWKRGLLFRTYAVHWLNQAFRSFLYNSNATVRVPVYLQKALKHIRDAKIRLGDPNASVEALARETQFGESLIEAALASARSSRSLDLSFEDGGEGSRLKDLLQDPDDLDPYSPSIEDHSLDESLTGAMEALNERERFVIQKRFGIGSEREHTLAEVARLLGVSLERVRQIQMRAIHKLRTPALQRVVEPFLN